MTKPWYKSKLVWFNALVAMGTAVEASLHIVSDKFPPEVYFVLVVSIAVVNVLLRFATNTGIDK